MRVWRFCGFHPFDLNMLVNMPVAEFFSSTVSMNLCLCNFMNKMSNAYAEHTWILTVEQFFGLKCPEMLGSCKSAQCVNPMLFPHAVLALRRSFPLLPLQQQQKQNPPTTLLYLPLPCPVVFYLYLLRGLVCTKCV